MKRKVVVCPDSFKGSISSYDACVAMEKGLFDCEVIKIPIADGGEGTLDAVAKDVVTQNVTGPDGQKIFARYGVSGGTAVVEMAEAAGLIKTVKKCAGTATTYGVGELIKDALSRGISEVLLTVGGSATNDGGCGMMAALGVKFIGKNGQFVPTGFTLSDIEKIDISAVDTRLFDTKISILTDVTNTMVGKNGATYVYGRQKGATDDDLQLLERGMVHLADVIEITCGKDVRNIAGSGAGGGIASMLIAFFDNVSIVSGIDAVLDAIDFDKKIKGADLIVTGEGRLDAQSLQGKAISGVCRRAGDIPVYCVAGCVEGDREYLKSLGLEDIFVLTDICDDTDYCIANAGQLITKIVDKIPRSC